MKNRLSTLLTSIGLASIVLLVPANQLNAAGTAAGVNISNQATVDYKVGTVDQPQETSNNYTFVVDRKINLTVATTDGAAVSVTPGTSDNVLTFTVQNLGNGIQDFDLTAVARSGGTGAFGGTDDQDADSVAIFVEDGTTAGYQSGEDTVTYIDELAADATQTVYIVGDFSTGTFANGEIASYHLVAEAREHGTASSLGGALTETAGGDTTGSEDIVFADGQGSETGTDAVRGADYSDDSDFEIAASDLSVVKSSVVISDPTNGTSNPKAIPGAVVEYTITISNAAGAATATSINLSDSLNTEITAGTIAFDANGYDTVKGIEITAPNLYGGAATDLTNADDGDEGDFNVTATNTITTTGIELAATESATIKFRVVIQ